MVSISFGRSQPAGAWASVNRNGDNLQLSVQVEDKQLLEATGRVHDGYEKAFAVLPMQDGSWKRIDLKYDSTFSVQGARGAYDAHQLSINAFDQGVSLDRLQNEGVAFGVEIQGQGGSEPTTVWLQDYADNYKMSQCKRGAHVPPTLTIGGHIRPGGQVPRTSIRFPPTIEATLRDDTRHDCNLYTEKYTAKAFVKGPTGEEIEVHLTAIGDPYPSSSNRNWRSYTGNLPDGFDNATIVRFEIDASA